LAETKRWFWVGSRPDVVQALSDVFGGAPADGPLEPASGDVVVVDPKADRDAQAALPHGHAYSGVRALKEQTGVSVYVLVEEGDPVGVQLARFSLADGVLVLGADGAVDADEVRLGVAAPGRASLDDLLARLQEDAGSGGQESSLQRLMRFEREDTLLTKLQDAETGLFDGPYATLKLDEEWKRAHRFHQPLSLLLLDVGFVKELSDVDRRAALAESAGVFLNACRDIDVLARFSSDVFLFLLPGTGAEGARVLADRIVDSLAERLKDMVTSRPAAGLATVPSGEVSDRKRFVAYAEACLERAKAGGEGGVCTSWQ
jgi:diguanylate cyclase (GGDEF)-like protein